MFYFLHTVFCFCTNNLLYSLWLIEVPRKGVGRILAVYVGSVGLGVTLAFVLTGIVLSII